MQCNSSCASAASVILTIYKYDSQTCEAIPGAVFELTDRYGCTSQGITDASGRVSFRVLPRGSYTLIEIVAPDGYLPIDRVYNIYVDACGTIFVDGVRTSQICVSNTPIVSASFTATKVNVSTGAPLAGALYTLYLGDTPISSTYSTQTGAVSFSGLAPGTYQLEETAPPAGFQPNPNLLTVVVAPDGSVTILGEPANGYILGNVPSASLIFKKLDAATGLALPGAPFQLSQGGAVVATAISDSSGNVDFGTLPPGTYTLTENSAPAGYLPNDRAYQVVIAADGSITVDGVGLGYFSVDDVAFPGFYFVKTSAATGLPLAGAVYELRQNGALIGTSVSDLTGFVSFSNLSPGTYQLTEAVPPAGYIGDPITHQVVVSASGAVTIDGLPYQSFSPVNTPEPVIPPHVLGWMRSSETYGYVPGARIPNLIPPGGVFDGWDFPWARGHTLIQYFENNEIYAAALTGSYTQEALGIPYETLFSPAGRLVDETYVWDGGSGHQFFTGYFNGPVPGGWASWENVEVPDSLISPQTQLPVPGGYSPYHYSLRRFTAYMDVDMSRYSVDSAYLISSFPSGAPGEYVFPLNDSIFVFVNGILAYWTSTNLIGGENPVPEAEKRLYFDGLKGIYMTKEFVGPPPPGAQYVFTDGWYLTLGGTSGIADIAPFLRNGKNVVDVIADDYYFGGGMSRIDVDFSITPLITP